MSFRLNSSPVAVQISLVFVRNSVVRLFKILNGMTFPPKGMITFFGSKFGVHLFIIHYLCPLKKKDFT
jgi:hypothetical protein